MRNYSGEIKSYKFSRINTSGDAGNILVQGNAQIDSKKLLKINESEQPPQDAQINNIINQ